MCADRRKTQLIRTDRAQPSLAVPSTLRRRRTTSDTSKTVVCVWLIINTPTRQRDRADLGPLAPPLSKVGSTPKTY